MSESPKICPLSQIIETFGETLSYYWEYRGKHTSTAFKHWDLKVLKKHCLL